MKRWMCVIAVLMLMAGPAAASQASAQPHAGAAAPASARPPAHAASVPTLGLHLKFTEGFGHVRPRVVSYGGDPTSLVVGVHWSSWGGARAVGHGHADWVWPGWCVACGSVNLPATVVAFGLRTCAGHPAYAHVEWYFPSRGMTFSTHMGTQNVCNPKATGHVPEPPHAHCAPVGISGGRVDQLEVFGYGVRCSGARGLVRQLGLMPHYRHNARFHVGPWWCGSELSMQATKSGPQSFECESGDDNDVSFDVTPAGNVTRG